MIERELAALRARVATLTELLGEAREDVVDCLNEAQNYPHRQWRIDYHKELRVRIDAALKE
jgi:hypothetical protein